MKEQWLDHMRNQLKDYTETPPEGLWEDIEKELFSEEEDSKLIIPLKKETKFAFISNGNIKKIAAAILLLLSVGTGLWIWNDKEVKKSMANNELSQKNLPQKHKVEYNEKQIDRQLSATDHQTYTQEEYQTREKFNQQNVVITQKKVNSIDNNLEFNKENKHQQKLVNSELSKTNSDQSITDYRSQNIKSNLEASDKDKLADLEKEQKNEETKLLIEKLENEIQSLKKTGVNNSKWLAAVNGSGFGIAGNNEVKGYASINKERMTVESMVLAQNVLTNKMFADIIHSNQGKTVDTQIKHRTPLSFGAQIQYQLNIKWALVSGLQYTNLVSDLKSGTEDYYIKNEQIVDYLGVPLSLQYQFLNYKKWSTYANVGGQVDFPIQGKLKTSYINNGEVSVDPDRELNGLSTQFSTTLGIGFQYKILNRLSFYGEPSLVYYLDNGSKVSSIYNEKPLNFHLRVGLKWNLSK